MHNPLDPLRQGLAWQQQEQVRGVLSPDAVGADALLLRELCRGGAEGHSMRVKVRLGLGLTLTLNCAGRGAALNDGFAGSLDPHTSAHRAG